MSTESLFDISDLEDLHLEIMFAATPRTLISDLSKKKLLRRNKKNIFYIIFGVYLKESNQYIVFTSIFRKLNKLKDENWFETISMDSAVYDTKQEVTNYLHNFIGNFSEHERFLYEDIMLLEMMPAQDAFAYLLQWNNSIYQYFNLLIEEEIESKRK